MKSAIFCIQHRVVSWKSIDVLEEHVTYIFRAEEYAKQETSMKLLATYFMLSYSLAYSEDRGCIFFRNAVTDYTALYPRL